MKKLSALFGLSATVAAMSAHAAVDVTAITGASTDVSTVIAAIFGIAVLIVGGKLVRRAL